jgi:hypothetical protein
MKAMSTSNHFMQLLSARLYGTYHITKHLSASYQEIMHYSASTSITVNDYI